MEIHTTLENYIKPSTPTPSHLQTFKLSDQHRQFPDSPFNVTFFYHSNSPAATNFSLQSKLLQHSLAQTLTTFYLFAGRFKNDDTIICNDHGALFIESKTDTNLSDLLAHPDLLAVIRDNLVPSYRNNGSLLLVKYISFGCGGTAVSISVSHKIADLASLVTLLLHWTALSGGAGAGASDHIPIYQPDFNLLGQTEPHPGPTIEVSSSSSPSPSPSQPSSSGYSLRPSRKFISKRFVFSASKIKQLKNQVVKELSKIENDHPLDILPSRVDVVVGLIFKSAMVSANVSRSRVGIVPSFRPSLLIQAANIRTRMNPPLPESVIGNLTMLLPVTVEKESDMELHELVNKLLAGKIHANKLGKKFHGYDDDTRKVA
ncbi:vinorine synthase-like [Quillaja saponaria]|uniref:Vinorine synthase-like n=1 Tax=Quillaja saponaria TaxID=32244 RepID=A0AAD7L2A2_QUISA|nr:vinorine synthase-like [Quillaja saponaria]